MNKIISNPTTALTETPQKPLIMAPGTLQYSTKLNSNHIIQDSIFKHDSIAIQTFPLDIINHTPSNPINSNNTQHVAQPKSPHQAQPTPEDRKYKLNPDGSFDLL